MFLVLLSPMLDQNRSKLARASSGPPLASPEASRTALMAPALAPLTASSSRSSSSSRRSSTPQVNAPKAPPPCNASDSRRVSPDGSVVVRGGASGWIEGSDPASLSGPLTRLSAEPRSLEGRASPSPASPENEHLAPRPHSAQPCSGVKRRALRSANGMTAWPSLFLFSLLHICGAVLLHTNPGPAAHEPRPLRGSPAQSA